VQTWSRLDVPARIVVEITLLLCIEVIIIASVRAFGGDEDTVFWAVLGLVAFAGFFGPMLVFLPEVKKAKKSGELKD
jgi:hypothetical protein